MVGHILDRQAANHKGRRQTQRAFTLVELMIVVAIIGVLAALAIYGVRRYLAASKTSEAKNNVGAISRGAAAEYMSENAKYETLSEGAQSTGRLRRLCTSANSVPGDFDAGMLKVKGRKYQPRTRQDRDFFYSKVAKSQYPDPRYGWRCLKFSINQPIAYQYNYRSYNGAKVAINNQPPPNGSQCDPVAQNLSHGHCYEASARGDLDGDDHYSIFARTGQVNPATLILKASTQLYVENEFE